MLRRPSRETAFNFTRAPPELETFFSPRAPLVLKLARIVEASTVCVGPKLGLAAAEFIGVDDEGNEVRTGQVVLLHRPEADWIVAVSRCK